MEKHDARLNIQNENMIVEMGDREIEGGLQIFLFIYRQNLKYHSSEPNLIIPHFNVV